MAVEQTLSDLTASLMQELARSAADVDRGQRDQWVALAREAALPEEEFVGSLVTPAAVEQYIGAAYPFLPDLTARTANCLASHMVPLDDAAKAALAADLGEEALAAVAASPVNGVPLVIARETLQQLVAKKLRAEAAERRRVLQATLRARVPKVEIARGTLSVKVLLRETEGKMTARLATPEGVARSPEAVSTVTVEFTVGAFPSFEA